MQPFNNISNHQNLVFGSTEKGRFWHYQSTDNQYDYNHQTTSISTRKELDQVTGFSYFAHQVRGAYHGARYLDHGLTTAWLSVDPMADKYPSISPYAYCAWNPVKLVDPSGDTCKFASDVEKAYIMQLLNPENEKYSKAFADVFQDLEIAEYTYFFESWYGDESADGKFTPRYKNNKTSLIQFTIGETKDTKNKKLGMSEFKILFEETFHAWKYEKNNHCNVPTCYSEALAWQFSALAPGTVLFSKDINDLSLMGYILLSDPCMLAWEFKFGFFNKKYSKEPLYPDLPLCPNNTFRRNMGWPEWH